MNDTIGENVERMHKFLDDIALLPSDFTRAQRAQRADAAMEDQLAADMVFICVDVCTYMYMYTCTLHVHVHVYIYIYFFLIFICQFLFVVTL